MKRSLVLMNLILNTGITEYKQIVTKMIYARLEPEWGGYQSPADAL